MMVPVVVPVAVVPVAVIDLVAAKVVDVRVTNVGEVIAGPISVEGTISTVGSARR